ncbi:hypothetical protein FOZ62_016636, partial [Perkinsus olseni]
QVSCTPIHVMAYHADAGTARRNKHKVCSITGCTKLARKDDSNEVARYCVAHGGGKSCIYPGCSASARDRRGLCYRHRGNSIGIPRQQCRSSANHDLGRADAPSSLARAQILRRLANMPVIKVAQPEPLRVAEAILGRLIEAHFNDLRNSSRIPPTCTATLSHYTTSSILKEWKRLRGNFSEWGVSARALRDGDILVRLARILFNGDCATFAFELMRAIAMCADESGWPAATITQDLLQAIKPAVFVADGDKIVPILNRPPKWAALTRVLDDAVSAAATRARVDESPQVKVAVIAWSKRSISLIRKLLRLGPNAAAVECYRNFAFSLHRHRYFKGKVNIGMIGLTCRELVLLKEAFGYATRSDCVPIEAVTGKRKVGSKLLELNVELFDIRYDKDTLSPILNFNPDLLVLYDTPVDETSVDQLTRILRHFDQLSVTTDGEFGGSA